MKPKSITRSIGILEAGHWLGCGFMHKPGWTVDEMNAEFHFFSLVYVIRGQGEYVDQHGKRYALKPGSLFQRRPGILHSNTIDPDSDWYECFLDYGRETYAALLSMGILDNEASVYQIATEQRLDHTIAQFLEQLEQGAESDLPELFIGTLSLIRQIMKQAHASTSEDPVEQMIEKSCQDFGEMVHQRLDLKAYCQENGWGYERFRKAFRERLGMAPGKYLVRRRIDVACQTLRSTKKSITEIAWELGYQSPYEFSAQFKRQIGISPSLFRTGRPD